MSTSERDRHFEQERAGADQHGQKTMPSQVSGRLGFFDRLTEESQRMFLVSVLDDPSAMKDQFGGMLEAWTRGDVKAIGDSFNRDLAEAAELKDALLVRRNANWANWVKGRLDQPGSVLVAVGAGHLAGEQSVQAMIEHQGVKVNRIQ